VTESGTISGPALSSDGGTIAYRAAAPVALEALGRLQVAGEIADFDLPSDLFLYDLTSGTTARIAEQPADASLFVDGVPDRAIVRSAPAWSPDRARLAWTEFAFGAEGAAASLIVYDQATRVHGTASVALPVVRGAAPTPLWGEGGLAVEITVNDDGSRGYQLLTADGVAGPTVAAQVQPGERVEHVAWVAASAETTEAWFGVLFSSGRWALYDPVSGLAVQTEGVPQLYARAAGAASPGLRFDVVPEIGFFWETVEPGSPAAAGAYPAPPARVTLAPDGRTVAFLGYPDFSAAALYRDGAMVAIPGTGGDGLAAGALLWGATGWRLGPAPAAPP
jgi:hypothetical protein